MLAKKRERRHTKATGQTFDASTKIPHFIVIFLVRFYVYQPQFLPDPSSIRADIDEQESRAIVPHDVLPAVAPHDLELDPFANMECL